MKVIDCSASEKKQSKTNWIERVSEPLRRSWSGKDTRAQDAIISSLQRVLDNRFYLLRNVTLEGPDVPIPLILLGPPGVRVIYASTAKGVYRAKEDNWEIMDDRTQHFNPTRPNLLSRTQLMSRAVTAYLTTHGYKLQEEEPVLFFSDPGIHVDAVRPIVRIVLADALDRFVAGLVQEPPVLDQDSAQKIVNLLTGFRANDNEAKQIPEGRDIFSFRDLPPERPLRPSPEIVIDRSEPSLLRKIPFTSRQWVLLGLMVLVNVMILFAFVVLILMTS